LGPATPNFPSTEQLLVSFACLITISIVTPMQWFWYLRCHCTFPFNTFTHDFYRILLITSHFNNLTWNDMSAHQ
jgi:hypothetical protein